MGHIYTATSPDSRKTELANATVSLITGGDPDALEIDHSARRFLVVDFGAGPEPLQVVVEKCKDGFLTLSDHLAGAGRVMASFGEAIQMSGVPIELLQDLPDRPWWELVVDIHFGLFFSAPTKLLGNDPFLTASNSCDPVADELIRRLRAAQDRRLAAALSGGTTADQVAWTREVARVNKLRRAIQEWMDRPL